MSSFRPGPSSSRPPNPQAQPSRPISHEENDHLLTLLSTLESQDALTVRAIHHHITVPQARQRIRQEISAFRRHTTTTRPVGGQFYPPGTLFATVAENLVEVCQSVGRKGKEERISFETFVRRRKEAETRREREKERSVVGPPGRGDKVMEDDRHVASGSRDKGKRRARRKIWDDDDEEGDILDALN